LGVAPNDTEWDKDPFNNEDDLGSGMELNDESLYGNGKV
jgi:hypothetical protein